MATKKSVSKEDARVFAVISYLSWFGLIAAIVWYMNNDEMKNNKFAKLHFKQAITLWLAALAGVIIGGILTIIVIGIFIIQLVTLAASILAIIGIINAVRDKEEKLPVIGEYDSFLKF